jgi:hypothetical protein
MMGPVFLAYGLLFALLIQCSDITTEEVSDSDEILADIQGKWKLEDSFIEIEIKGDSVVDYYKNPKDDLYFKDKYKVSITKEMRIYGKLYKADSNEFFLTQ